MNKLFCYLFIIFALSSCFPRRKAAITTAPQVATNKAPIQQPTPDYQKNNQEIKRASQAVPTNNNQVNIQFTLITSLQYIARFKAIAIQEMNLYGIPASITIAQGLFESGSGNGELARYAKNHFGIKCTSDWKGRSYYKDDDHPNDCFRVYDKDEDSYRDHSLFLKRKNYLSLYDLDKKDYKGWAYGLKKAGYATNPNYPTLLINIIEKYHLYDYDITADDIKTKPDTLQLKPISSPDSSKIVPLQTSITFDKYYTVKQGDTLYNISKRFNLTVNQLKALNNMLDNGIKIGQKIIIAP